ncbi:MAG TPA: hypothetical protein VE131_04680, partial [Terriglobales bacterium]|nr:hypothetical protein [Terriglobales bacterium]
MNAAALTLHEASVCLRRRELSAQELTQAVFQRIAETDDRVRAYVTLCQELAFQQAKVADELLARGD